MKKPLVITLAALAVICLLSGFMFRNLLTLVFSDKKASAAMPANSAPATKTLYDFTATTLNGKPITLKQFAGKKVVILNTASQCGYTPQYDDWETFYKAHGDKVVVLGFPANNFMGQEPGTNTEIAQFCKKNYGVTFPMFEKVSVLGSDQAPIYKWLTTKALNGWNDKSPTWNFCKYVIDEKGLLTHFFASGVKPQDAEFKKAVGL